MTSTPSSSTSSPTHGSVTSPPAGSTAGPTGQGRAERRSQPLDDHGHALASTDTHRLEAHGLVGVLQAVQEGGHDAGAGHAEGVSEGDGPAVDVELVVRDAEMAGGGDDLGGESLIDL